MKQSRVFAAILLLGSIIGTSGCSKPEEPNHFRYTVNDYPLDQGFIHNFGLAEDATGYNFDVTLYSNGVSYNRDKHEFSGTGNVVFFQLYSSSATELAAGTYQFTTESKAPSTFNVANFGMTVNFTEQTGTIVNAVSGIVKVSIERDSYVLDFECLTATGEKVTGHWNRSLTTHDMREAKK